MTLPVGARLGRVEILSPLGAGGMGEVYRARDARLKRDIAVKVLPAMSASDADRLARFRREAEMLATLNHPNIAAIYGFEDEGGTHALLLELIEGPTLADRLQQGPIAVSDALPIARQITEALAAAHERGIVHRDLKPANIKVRDDGVVKVLDFGLAKALETQPSGGTAPEVATATAAELTRVGTILGTAAYMSPEQARGLTVDKRTDVWAFGCVLFEMLTGRAAFARPTVTDSLAAVVGEPPDWTALPPGTPPIVRRLLRRCLEKDVRRRLHDIADARLDLEDIDTPLAVDSPHRARAYVPWMIAVPSALVVVAASAALWFSTRGTEGSSPEPVRFSIDLRPGETLPLDAGLPVPVAISRDGRSIVFVTRGQSGHRIYLRRVADLDATVIAGTEGGSGPFVSPDGQWLGFAAGGFIRKVPIQGGAPQNITKVDYVLMSASWSEAGSIVFNGWQSGLFRVSADGGMPEPLTSLDVQTDEQWHQSPWCLPGGQAALFSVLRRGRPPAVELVEITTGRRKHLLEGSSPQFVSSGHLMFVRNGRLHAAPFDLTGLDVTGPAVPLADDLAVTVVQERGTFAVSLDGTLAYLPTAPRTSRLVVVDASGSSRTLVDGRRDYDHPRLSPDGTRLVVSVDADSGDDEFWVHDLVRNSRLRLSASGGRPIWSHDGKSITFQKDLSLYTVPADDSRPPEVLLARDASANALFPLAWSRDGSTLVYSRPAPGTNRDVFTLSPGGSPTPFLVTARDERSAMLSPDMRWMVYAALEPGREEEVYVERHPGAGGRVVVSVGGGREPVWSPRGDEIYYRSIDGQRMLAVTVRTEPSLTIGRPRTVFQGSFRPGLFWSNYDVHPKTGEFVMLAVDEPLQPRLTVAMNWTQLLGRR